ncbi:MAG TPA: ABC transporter ATP-binding protein [Polyangia bacterium]|nr:ABC transporter ATP-binding protein [Polyangia bacterium]
MRSELGRFVLGCLCLVGTNAFSLAIPWLLKQAIDAFRTLAPTVAHAIVVRDAIAIIVFAVLQALIRTWSRIFIFDAARNIEYGLRRDLFAHLTRLDPAFYRRHPTGDVMSRMTNDLTAVRALYGPGLLNLFNTALLYATALWLLLQLSPRLTLLALLPYPLLLVVARLASRRIHRASRLIQDQLGTMSTAIQEDLAGIAVIKHYALEASREKAFRGVNDEYLNRSLALVRVRGALMPLFAVLGGVGTLIVLWAGGREVIAGRMTVGSLVAFNGYLVLLSWPTFALGWIIGIWQRGVAGWARVRELLDTTPAIADARDNDVPAAAGAPKPSVDVRDLVIAADGRRLLDGVSFALPAGATLAIVGRTGSGKTTLVDAVLRMQEVAPGAVSVGGRDVTRMPLGELRGMIGYAPQDAFLFSATVAENIAFGIRGDVDAAVLDERVRRAAEAAGLAPDVAVLPDGYGTLVGERGITLSGGQRQRVALARALAADPQILILDDSLSSVDAETERAILTRLRPILAGRTSILISHRVAAVKDADQILVLDGGRIAESGTHAALLASGGVYASLYREQLAQEAVE